MTTLVAPICLGCSHFREQDGAKFSCDAYPGGIPEQIIRSEVDHRQPYSGDKDIQYVPKTPSDAAYAEMLFQAMTPRVEWLPPWLPPKEWGWEPGEFEADILEKSWLAWSDAETAAFLASGKTMTEWLADRPKEFVEKGRPPNG